MTLDTFINANALYLIPAAHSKIFLGNLVWKSQSGIPAFSRLGNANHIGNALNELGAVNKLDWHRIQQELERVRTKKTRISEYRFQEADRVAGTLFDGQRIGYEAVYVLDAKLVDVCTKIVSRKMHLKLAHYLGIVGLKELEAYFGDFHNVYMVTKLYYGTVELTVEDEHELFFEHMIPKDLSYVALNQHTIRGNVYSFKHNNIPFACKLEPLSAKLEVQSAST